MTNSRARPGPARSAIRWVPPAPGVRPTTAATRPKRADSVAQIRSQPSETSSPAVRQSPWTRARVGIGSASRRRTPAISAANISPPSSGFVPAKTLTSAPPVKTSPSARQTRALASDPSTSATRASSASNASAPKRLRGGLSRTRTATAPSRSSLTGSAIAAKPTRQRHGLLPCADLAGVLRRLELGEQLAELGALLDAELHRQLVAAQE